MQRCKSTVFAKQKIKNGIYKFVGQENVYGWTSHQPTAEVYFLFLCWCYFDKEGGLVLFKGLKNTIYFILKSWVKIYKSNCA